MQQEPAQELDAVEGHCPRSIPVGSIAVAERDGVVGDAQEPPITDSNAMGVAGEVF